MNLASEAETPRKFSVYEPYAVQGKLGARASRTGPRYQGGFVR